MADLFDIPEVSSGGGIKVIKPGKYDGVLVGFVDHGVHERTYQGQPIKPARMIKLIFEIPSLSEDDRPCFVGKELPMLLSERANFIKTLLALEIITKVDREQLKQALDTENIKKSILGKGVILKIANFEKDSGDSMHYIESLTLMDSRIPAPKPTVGTFYFGTKAPDYKVFSESLSRFSRKKIMDSADGASLPKEFKELVMSEQEEGASKKSGVADVGDVI